MEELRQIAARLPQSIFEELRRRAKKELKSMSEKIREYVEVGLEVDDDWDEDRKNETQSVEKTCEVDLTKAPGLSKWTTDENGVMSRTKTSE